MHQFVQGQYAVFGSRVEVRPVAEMLFRPEEIHVVSRVGDSVHPFGKWDFDVSRDRLRVSFQNLSIFHFNVHLFPTVEAGGVDADRLAGVKPADRQRFETSLSVTFWLTVHGDAVLGWQVA